MKMTISSNASNERTSTSAESNRSLSPNSSPRSSPRPSPRPQAKRDHSKSETHLTVNYYNNKEPQHKAESSPSSQDGSISGRSSNADISPSGDLKADIISAPVKEKKEGRTKKKSSWFNFYSTYKSKSEDLKRLFKDVPDDERLVVDYSCALQKEILVHGRLYVTQNFLAFYANIFGWETNVTIKWKDVAAITKEKTALVIPNAVLICTRNEKFFFTSFAARDKTFLMLFRVWQNALLDQPVTGQELWQWVHQCYGDELGLTSDDEDYIAPGTEEDKLSTRLSVESFAEIRQETSTLSDSISDNMEENIKSSTPVEHNKTKSTNSSSENQLPTDVTDNSESEAETQIKENPATQNHCSFPTVPNNLKYNDSDDSTVDKSTSEIRCSCSHAGRQLVNEIIPIHIDHLFTLLFTSSKFYLDFQACRKTTDLTQTAWTMNPIDNSKTRVVTLTMPLTHVMGPKSAQVTEAQTMLPCSKAGYLYSIDVESTNAGVPYADNFCVLVHYCLQKISDTHSSLMVFGEVKYKRSLFRFVQNMIDKNCWLGLEDFFGHLVKQLHLESEECISTVNKRNKSRTKRIKSINRADVEEASLNVPCRNRQSGGIFNFDIKMLIVLLALIILLILNVLLYYKLWSLEESSPYTVLDLHVLQNPPKSHDEWIKLLQQQETLHTIEAQKWQKVLRNSIHLLRQVEESLNELQRSIHPTYTNKIVSIIKNDGESSGEKEL